MSKPCNLFKLCVKSLCTKYLLRFGHFISNYWELQAVSNIRNVVLFTNVGSDITGLNLFERREKNLEMAWKAVCIERVDWRSWKQSYLIFLPTYNFFSPELIIIDYNRNFMLCPNIKSQINCVVSLERSEIIFEMTKSWFSIAKKPLLH